MKPHWVRLPTTWIERGGLRQLVWADEGVGADNIAALMTLALIAHHADQEAGTTRLTYHTLSAITELSRAKLSNGLDVLERAGAIERAPYGRSSFQLADFDPKARWRSSRPVGSTPVVGMPLQNSSCVSEQN
jgi:hypothetical protein